MDKTTKDLRLQQRAKMLKKEIRRPVVKISKQYSIKASEACIEKVSKTCIVTSYGTFVEA